MPNPPARNNPRGSLNDFVNTTQVQVGTKSGSLSEYLYKLLSQEQKQNARNASKLQQRNLKQKLTRTNRTAFDRARKAGAFAEPKCRPALDVYLASANETVGIFQKKVSSRSRQWLCGAKIDFKEQKYAVQNNDLRVYIEGADVTPYVMGNVRWSLETTGGMNTASFTLNNNHDAFIITPANICANLNKSAWRVHGTGWRLARDRGGKIIPHQGRANARADELAKYVIYYRKYKAVQPGTKQAEIDPETGVWLYPLNPFSSVIHKHDSVRIFIRLPHVSAVKRPNYKEWHDLWIPAFTGFVSAYSWDDRPVTAERTMNIQCYDIRGLYERMRVRINVNPTPEKLKSGAVRADIVEERFKSNRTLLQTIGLDKAVLEKLKGVRNMFKEVLDRWLNCLAENAVLLTCRTSDLSINSDCFQKALQAAKTTVQEQSKPLVDKMSAAQKIVDKLNAIDVNNWLLERDTRQNKTIGIQVKLRSDLKIVKPTRTNVDGQWVQPAQGDINVLKNGLAYIDGRCKALVTAVTKVTLEKFVANTVLLFNSPLGFDILLPIFQAGTYAGAQLQSTSGIVITGVVDSLTKPIQEAAAFVKTGIDNGWIIPVPPIQEANSLDERTKKIGIWASKLTEDFGKSTANQLNIALTGISSTLTARLKDITQTGAHGGQTAPKPIFTEADRLKVRQRLLEEQKKLPSPTKLQAEVKKSISGINDELRKIEQFIKNCEKQQKTAVVQSTFRRKGGQLAEAQRMVKRFIDARNAGRAQARAAVPNSGATMADLFENRPIWTDRNAGIFADLVRNVGKHSHPLSEMSFEQSIEWLVMENTNVVFGARSRVVDYRNPGRLDNWNRVCVFGQLGRPLTYQEMKIIGEGTVTDIKEVFSPLNVFLNMLTPEQGTGGSTIVQRHLSANPYGATSHQYETRKSMIDQVCTLLDYQCYISPMGDWCFEFPNYNILPSDFGPTFRGAYEVDKQLISSSISEESGDLPTAWVLTGSELDKELQGVIERDFQIKNRFATITIMAPILARRLGIKVEDVNIALPGVGANFGPNGTHGPGGVAGALASLIIYGLFHINRQFGRMHKLQVSTPFRPYILPNRPIHLIPRQRIGLVKTVNYAMSPPGGECTTETDIGYVRWLNRDGTFRHAGGGTRMPLDYTQFQPGSVSLDTRRSAGNFSNRQPDVNLAALRSNDTVRADNGSRQGPGRTGSAAWNQTAVGEPQASALRAAFAKGKTLSGSTAGAKGTSKTVPTKPNTGVGRRAHRRPGSAGGPEASVKPSTGIQSSLDKKTGSKGSNDAKAGLRGDGTIGIKQRYDSTKLFYDAIPFFTHKPPNEYQFNQWGFVRTPGDAPAYHILGGKKYPYHSGVDLFANPKNSNVYAPIPFFSIEAAYQFGSYLTADKARAVPVSERYVIKNAQGQWVQEGKTRVFNVPADMQPFFVKKPHKISEGVRKARGILPGEVVKIKIKPDDPNAPTRFIETTYKFLLVNEYETWLKIRKKTKRIKPVQSTSIHDRGLYLQCEGYVSLPGTKLISASNIKQRDQLTKGPDGTVYRKLHCQLLYLHLGDIYEGPRGVYGAGTNEAPADPEKVHPLGQIGSTGNAGTALAHLHLTMKVRSAGRISDTTYSNTLREVLKARNEFLTRILAYKLTTVRGNLKEDPLNSTLSEAWKKRLRGKLTIKVQENGQTVTKTIDVNTAKAVDVIDALVKWQNVNSSFSWFTNPNQANVFGKKNLREWIDVNPLWFFTPEQIIDNAVQRSATPGGRIYGSKYIKSSRQRRAIVKDNKQHLCKRLGSSGLEKTRKKSVIKRTDVDRKSRSARNSFTSGARKRQIFQKQRRLEERMEERDITRQLALVQSERLEGALHASVRQYLDFDQKNTNQENAWKTGLSRFGQIDSAYL